MRIAIVGINYAPEQIGIARYTAQMAQALAARGHRVEVIVGKPYYPEWRVAPEWRGGGWRRSVEDGVAVTRCPHYVPSQPSGLRRILHLASFGLTALWPVLGLARRARADRPELVICLAPALLSVPVAWLGARLCGARLWVHVQDFEVEAAFATGLVDGGGMVARLARGVERAMLGLGDRVSSISPQMCRKLVEKGIAADRVTEVRNWADATVHPDPAGGAAYRAEWALGDARVALYSGNIANKQGVEILIEAARRLAHRSDFAMVICGDGPNRERLQQLASGLPNVQLHGLQPAARMSELLGLASLHLLPQLPGAADLVLPSKLTNMLASGRPVVATASPDTGLYDEVDGCGLCTTPGDAAELAGAIERLLDNPDLCAELGAAGLVRASERWSFGSILDRFEASATKLVSAPQ